MKKILASLILALASLPGWSQAVPISGQVINTYGQPVAGALVRVCLVTSSGTPCTPTSTIYSDYQLAHAIGNPASADQYGNYTVYAATLSSGNYYLVQVSPDSTNTWSYVVSGGASANPYVGCTPVSNGITCTGPLAGSALTLTGAPNGSYAKADGSGYGTPGTNTGTVTSVALTLPNWLTVAGSPITTNGTFAVTGTVETQNYFLAAPNGTNGAMTPRAIVLADLPSSLIASYPGAGIANSTGLAWGTSYSATNVIPANFGGSGEAGTLTGLLYANGTSPFTAATNLQVDTLLGTLSNCGTATYVYSPPANGCVPPSAAAGTVTSFSAGNLSPLFTTSVATATSTPALTFTLSTASQNSVFAGPASGGAGAPSFQNAPTISAANMTSFPTLNQNTTGTATGISGTQTANTFLAGPNGSNGLAVFRAIVAADIPTLNQNTTGTATGLSGSRTANYVLAAPDGSAGTATFRAIVADDLPLPGCSNCMNGTPTHTGDSCLLGGTATFVGPTPYDARGVISVTTGSGSCTPGASGLGIVTIPFGGPNNGGGSYANAPECQIQAANINASVLASAAQPYVLYTDTTSSQFIIRSGTSSLAITTTYIWSWSCHL